MERISKESHYKDKTFLITSNNPLVFGYCDRVIQLEDGEIVYSGTYDQAPFKGVSNKENNEENQVNEVNFDF